MIHQSDCRSCMVEYETVVDMDMLGDYSFFDSIAVGLVSERRTSSSLVVRPVEGQSVFSVWARLHKEVGCKEVEGDGLV